MEDLHLIAEIVRIIIGVVVAIVLAVYAYNNDEAYKSTGLRRYRLFTLICSWTMIIVIVALISKFINWFFDFTHWLFNF